MTQKILFLGSGSPFMMNAVMGNLSNAGYDVLSAEPTEAAVRKNGADREIIVLFLGAARLERTEVLQAVNEFGGAPDRLLFVIGDESELTRCRETIPETSVAASFSKPLDVKKFLAKVARVSSDPKARETPPILLVDDDADYLKMVKSWLSRKYRVVVVNSGMQALTYLANNKPALILLDYWMPVTSGPQVLEMIRSEPETKKIPVVFLTGKDDSESVNRVLSLKPDGYILKSIDRDSLLERLDEFFANNT